MRRIGNSKLILLCFLLDVLYQCVGQYAGIQLLLVQSLDALLGCRSVDNLKLIDCYAGSVGFVLQHRRFARAGDALLNVVEGYDKAQIGVVLTYRIGVIEFAVNTLMEIARTRNAGSRVVTHPLYVVAASRSLIQRVERIGTLDAIVALSDNGHLKS